MTKTKKTSDIYQDQIIQKPWGYETIFIPSYLNYTFKMLTIKKETRISLQSHDQKRETFVLVSGKAKLTTGKSLDHLNTIEMVPFKGYSIEAKTIHRITAEKEDAIIIEGSTKETGTTIRYQDDYNRPDETEDIRKQNNRGWHN